MFETPISTHANSMRTTGTQNVWVLHQIELSANSSRGGTGIHTTCTRSQAGTRRQKSDVLRMLWCPLRLAKRKCTSKLNTHRKALGRGLWWRQQRTWISTVQVQDMVLRANTVPQVVRATTLGVTFVCGAVEIGPLEPFRAPSHQHNHLKTQSKDGTSCWVRPPNCKEILRKLSPILRALRTNSQRWSEGQETVGEQ